MPTQPSLIPDLCPDKILVSGRWLTITPAWQVPSQLAQAMYRRYGCQKGKICAGCKWLQRVGPGYCRCLATGQLQGKDSGWQEHWQACGKIKQA